MYKPIFFIAFAVLFGCRNNTTLLKIDASVAKKVQSKIDTIGCAKDYTNADEFLQELFNTDLQVSDNGSDFFEPFSHGGISMNKKGDVNIVYRLAESSGPVFDISIINRKASGNFHLSGDDSRSSNTVDLKIKRLEFDRSPIIGKSLCFYIDFEAHNFHFKNEGNRNSKMKIYGYITKVLDGDIKK